MTLCLGEDATSKKCNAIWKDSSKNILTPASKKDWDLTGVNVYEDGLTVVKDKDSPVTSKQSAVLEPRREYFVQCTVVNKYCHTSGYKFGIGLVDSKNTIVKTIESSVISGAVANVGASTSSTLFSTSGLFPESKPIQQSKCTGKENSSFDLHFKNLLLILF